MIKYKLAKSFMIALCMSALTTGVAFAQSDSGSTSSYQGQMSVKESALLDKQSEIDQYLFVDHIKEIEEKGFQIVYTGVNENSVEIGITPYSEDNAKYLYDIFGKDEIKIVYAEEANMYTTMDTVLDRSVSNTDVVDPVAADTNTDDNQKLEIQNENQPAYATAVRENDEIVNAVDYNMAGEKGEKDGLSMPLIVLGVVGGIVLIGGTIIVVNKKNTMIRMS